MQENYYPLFARDPKNPNIPEAIVELNNLDIPQLKQMIILANAYLTQKAGTLTAEEYEMMQEIIKLGNQKIPELNAVVKKFLTQEEVDRRRPNSR